MIFLFRPLPSLHCLIILLLWVSVQYGQDQRIADSLKVIYEQMDLSSEGRLEILSELAYNETRDDILRESFARELIRAAQKANDPEYIYNGYNNLGNVLLKAGNITRAIDAYNKCLKIARETKSEERQTRILSIIARTYSNIEDRENAIAYYKNLIGLYQRMEDTLNLGVVSFNLGDELIKSGRFDEAIGYLDKAGAIFEENSFDLGLAYVEGNRGVIAGKKGRISEGIAQIRSAIRKLEELDDSYAAVDFTNWLAGLYSDQKNFEQAIATGERGLKLALEKGLKEQIRDAYKALYQVYAAAELKDESLSALQNYYIYRDSIKNVESVQELATLRYDADMSLKQAELDLSNQKRSNQRIVLWATGIVTFLLSFLAIGMFRKNKYVRKTNEIIDNERRRSEHLLLNILPEQTAQELKEKGKVKAKKFESATVLFTDFVDFTKYAEKLEPEKLVKGMDLYYGQFDKIMEKYGLEKIKTVGDSYMCAGGIPNTDPDHAVKMVRAALDIVAYVESIKEARAKGKTRFDIRVGINSGPIVAGVVGTKKFAYDIWGDTVNVAARMENRSEPGRVNISENTYALIKDHFDCEFRGEIEAKNKGRLKMYFVKGETGSDIPRPIQAKTIKQKETPV